MKKITAILLAILMMFSGCTPRPSAEQTQESSAPPVQGNAASSTPESSAVVSHELPNGWQLSDFTVAGFDKDGPGDFGHRVTLDEEQLSRFAELLDIESWQELETPIEYGLTVSLNVADEDIERFLTVMNGGEFGTVISLSGAGMNEKLVYTAPAEVVEDAKELAAELKGQTGEPVNELDSSPSDAFYPAAAAYLEYDGSAIRGRHDWNGDGTLTLQHENTLTTLSADNQVFETITLPLEFLPADSGYDLTWSESYIIAIDRQTEESWNQYGVAYFTDNGDVYLANLALFDRQGNLIRQYYQGEVGRYDESGNYERSLPCPEGEEILSAYYLADGNHTYWLDDHTVIFNCHSRIVLYDFTADAGRVLDDMSELVDYHGKFGIYYGSERSRCGVLDGSFYYLARHSDQKSYTLWCADKNGSEELFDGKEFWYLKVARQSLLLCDYVDPTNGETDDRVYIADPDDGLVLKEILIGDPTIPFFDNGVIGFHSGNYWEEDGAILYAYDYRSGELYTHSLGRPVQIDATIAKIVDGSLRYYYTLFEDGVSSDWVYDTETDTTTELTEYGIDKLDTISFSPDGIHYVEYDMGSEQPRLCISRWTY